MNGLRDERGAIMIVGLVMAVFLVALLYYVIGIGEAVLYRELLQDASDTAVLSSALIHARGMNFIVLINLIMAALMTILLVLQVLMTLLRVAIIALALASWLSVGATAGLAALLAEVHQGVQSIYTPTEQIVMELLTNLHEIAHAVSIAVPPVAVLDTIVQVNAHHQGPAKFAFAVPTRITLPVEADAYSVLCERAQANVADLAMRYLPEAAHSLVGSAAHALTAPSAAWLCGPSRATRPSYEQQQTRAYPTLAEYKSCIDDPEASLSSEPERERCEQLREANRHAQPDEHGNCRTGEECSIDGPYEQMMALTREQCRPDPRRALRGYRWQQKKVSLELKWTGERWQEVDRDEEQGRIMPSREGSSPFAPCGAHAGAVGEGWRERVHPSSDVTKVNAVCSEDYEVDLPLTSGLRPGHRHYLEYESVTQILSCEETKTIHVPFGVTDAMPSGDGSSGREPHRVFADLELGAEPFQLRALAIADGLTPVPERVIKIASWNQCENGNCSGIANLAATLSRFSAAQAEYYYDHDGSEARSEWMWNMKWRARLVRLRPLGASDDAGQIDAPNIESRCTAIPGAEGCSEAADSLTTLADVSLH